MLKRGLFGIREDIRMIMENSVNDETGEISTAAFDQLLSKKEEFDEVALNMGLFVKECEADADKVAAVIRELQARKNTFENAAERTKLYILDAMRQSGYSAEGKKKKIVGDIITLSMRKGSERCEILNGEAVPGNYVKVKTEISIADVKAALKAGTEVPGAKLIRGDDSLTITLKNVGKEREYGD